MRLFFGASPWSKQVEILEALRDNRKVAVRSANGVGKSYIAAQAILWFLYTHAPSVVLSTAPTMRQVKTHIWKEVRSSFYRAGAEAYLGGYMPPKSPELHIDFNKWYALGLSTNRPDRFQGWHERYILAVIDEAAGVDERIHEAIDGILTSETTKLLLLGNPTHVGGSFYDAFRRPGFNKIHISAFDTPNFVEFGITEENIINNTWKEKVTGDWPNPWLVNPLWVSEVYKKWGPKHPAYQARVLGNFPEEGEMTVISLAWIEAAMARWPEMPEGSPIEVGVDVARFGMDHTVIAVRAGPKLINLEAFSKIDTMETVGRVIAAYRRYKPSLIKVDSIGIGAGVVDRLKEQDIPVQGINVAAEAAETFDEAGNPIYGNLRAELWDNLRLLLNPSSPEPLGLPQDDDLLADLSGVQWRKYTSSGKLLLEEKEETKKRLGRSPDRGDAVMLAFAPARKRMKTMLFDVDPNLAPPLMVGGGPNLGIGYI